MLEEAATSISAFFHDYRYIISILHITEFSKCANNYFVSKNFKHTAKPQIFLRLKTKVLT